MGKHISACVKPKVPIQIQSKEGQSSISRTTPRSSSQELRPRKFSFLTSPIAHLTELRNLEAEQQFNVEEDPALTYRLALHSRSRGESLDDSISLFQFVLQRPTLTTEEEETLLNSWDVLKNNIQKAGAVTFLRLFEEFPGTQDLFLKFSKLPLSALEQDVWFQNHVLNFVSHVEKVVTRQYEPEKVESILHDLGTLHHRVGLTRESLFLIIPMFVETLKLYFEVWTDDLEKVWTKFMELICHVIAERMLPAHQGHMVPINNPPPL